jgi:HTH-type transcriptional regulator/antitoxin HipB
LIGVGQARVAAIEKNPGAVSLDQLLQIVHALGAKLQLVDSSATAPSAGLW